jgi:hypothetical protein
LLALDGDLNVFAQPRAGGPGVHGELLGDAEVGLAGRVQVHQRHGADIDLVCHDRAEGLQRRGVGGDDGEVLKRQAGPQTASLAQT